MPIAGSQTDDRRYEFDVWRDGVVEASGTVAATATALTITGERAEPGRQGHCSGGVATVSHCPRS
jgi:hypothetical protein